MEFSKALEIIDNHLKISRWANFFDRQRSEYTLAPIK